jgi:hypothetical protein
MHASVSANLREAKPKAGTVFSAFLMSVVLNEALEKTDRRRE